MRPRSIVFDLYGEYFRYRGGAAKLGVLTELLGVFGVEPATVRVVMTRLRREGWFDSERSGREVTYVLNDKSWRLLDDGRARIFERHQDTWDRTWTQALVEEQTSSREQRQRIEKALTWWGFGHGGGNSWFSPHDHRKNVSESLEGDDELQVIFLRSTSAAITTDRMLARRCWDLRGLGEDYQAFIEEYQPRLAGFRRGLSGPEALVERTALIQKYRHYPFRDPDLPEELLPAGWRGQVAHQTFLECHETLRAAAEELIEAVTTGSSARNVV
ncbi:PaaX family transcriptional regulator C-terminal domain-containing protein [Mycobacterium sp. URHB0044]|jgi:phenylacetic acid degradation operon negative regulatory protein|uniref:PaaX family transcriptional regulator n=1 Tax=Mycobacterium sp. URHB0044 TaxID=1380386 RepID=UPI00048FEDD2|nr:PaaX family transcriptional regulator C-terminal domain-containing protein [Mycobacterium sp. URHB0044]